MQHSNFIEMGIMHIISAIFIILCVIHYDKIIARFKQNKLNSIRRRVEENDREIEEINKLCEAV